MGAHRQRSLVQVIAVEMDAPLVQTAVEVLSRATSSSEVLTLNLTALIILGILKAAVVAFGLSGGSLLSSTNRSFQGRSSQEGAAGVSASDMTGGLCFLLFTSGDQEKISCVQRSACESPESAKDLLSAAKVWKKMHAIINAALLGQVHRAGGGSLLCCQSGRGGRQLCPICLVIV